MQSYATNIVATAYDDKICQQKKDTRHDDGCPPVLGSATDPVYSSSAVSHPRALLFVKWAVSPFKLLL